MRTRSRGVTLIELLIAVTLLSLLSVGMLMALRIGLNSMEKADKKLMANRRSFSTQQILRSQVEGFMPVGVMCAPRMGGPAGAAPVSIPFFDGRPQTLRFVSSYSLEEASRGEPRVLEFTVIPGDRDQGVRLVVNESLYTGPLSPAAGCIGMAPDPITNRLVPQFPPVTTGPRSFVLADKLAFCRFSYRHVAPEPVLEEWLAQWTLQEWPTAVRIEMAPLEADTSRVPLVTATVPLRVNRVFGMRYASQ